MYLEAKGKMDAPCFEDNDYSMIKAPKHAIIKSSLPLVKNKVSWLSGWLVAGLLACRLAIWLAYCLSGWMAGWQGVLAGVFFSFGFIITGLISTGNHQMNKK